MNLSDLKKSRFLTKEECGNGILVTITGEEELNVAAEGADPEYKWCLHFAETEKPLVLNSTNGHSIAAIAGSEESGAWHGLKIVLFNDPTVFYAGRKGGIRVRAPRGAAATVNAGRTATKTAPKPAPKPAPAQPEPAPYEGGTDPADSDVPF
jgi:hypothetical protein